MTISHFYVFGDEIWMWYAFGCGFVTFVLQCVGRIDHLVVFFIVVAQVVIGKTFVTTTMADFAFCYWRLGIRVLAFVDLIRLGFLCTFLPQHILGYFAFL